MENWKWMFRVFPSDKPLFLDHFPSKIIMSTQKALSTGRPEKWLCRVFTLKTPFQDHHPSKTTVLTQRPLSPGTPEHWMCRVSTPLPLTNDNLKTILYIELYQLRELCLPGYVDNECALFHSLTDKQPFQDHFPRKSIVPTRRSVSQDTWTINMQSLPNQQTAISRPSSGLKSTDVCCHGDLDNDCAFPHCH